MMMMTGNTVVTSGKPDNTEAKVRKVTADPIHAYTKMFVTA